MSGRPSTQFPILSAGNTIHLYADSKTNEIDSYPLEWLDLIITVTLNPAKINIEAITKEQTACIVKKTGKEVIHLRSLLKNEVFALTKQNKIKLLIQHQHSTLILLLDQEIEHEKYPVFKRADLRQAHAKMVFCLMNCFLL